MGAVGGRRDDLLRLGRVDAADPGSRARRSQQAHELGHGHRAVVLPAQHRLQDRRTSTTTSSADLTGQANHLGVTIEADIIKQKLPENNGGFNALKGFGKTHKRVY